MSWGIDSLNGGNNNDSLQGKASVRLADVARSAIFPLPRGAGGENQRTTRDLLLAI